MVPRSTIVLLGAAATLAAVGARPVWAAPTVGLSVGRAYLYTHSTAGTADGSSSFEIESVGSEGYVLEIAPGYEWSWGRACLAVELAFAYSNMRAGIRGDVSSVGASARAWTERIVTGSGRLGVEITPGTQIYGRVGYSTMEYRSRISALYGEIDERDYGEVQAVVAGGGLEVEFAPGWAVRFEYKHMNFDRATGVEDIEGVEDEQLKWMLEPRIETITVAIVRVY